MRNRDYIKLLQRARQVTRADEAEDLLQTVLLAAVEAGRANMTCAKNRKWLVGALLGSHDPDGNIFVLSSQNTIARQHKGN